MRNYYHFKFKKYIICFVLALMVVFTACNKLENNTDIQNSTIEDEKNPYSNIFSNEDINTLGRTLSAFKRKIGEPLSEKVVKYDQSDKVNIIILEYPFGKVNFCKSKFNNTEYVLYAIEIMTDDVPIAENVKVGDDVDDLISKSEAINDFLKNSKDESSIYTNEIKPRTIYAEEEKYYMTYEYVLNESDAVRLEFEINNNKIYSIKLVDEEREEITFN